MQYWDDKDANGNKLTDGRVCLVITSDSDPSMPAIRTYGKDREEVFDKLPDTIRTAQETIHRLRKSPSPPSAPPAAQVRPGGTVTVNEVAAAAADLTNPQKAPQAVRTLLKASGVDVDAQAQRQDADRLATVAQQWEQNNPDFPMDERNQRLLVDRTIVLAGGRINAVTAETFDRAYRQMREQNLFFEPVQPEGTPGSRTEVVRTATSYRRHALRQEPPAPSHVAEESAKVREWRKIAESGNTKQLADAIRNDKGFREWMDKEYARTA